MRKRSQVRRGVTLVELMIYMSLMTIVFGAIYGIFLAGKRYFEIARCSIEVQQAGNTIGYRLTRDLMESDFGTIQSYPNADHPTAPVGVVFLSARGPVQNPRDTAFAAPGEFGYDTTYGVPQWQKYIGYYLDDDPSYPGQTQMKALYTAEYVPAGFPKTKAEAGTVNSVTTATMRSPGDPTRLRNKRIVAHGIMAPAATSGVGAETEAAHGGFNVYFVNNGVTTYGSAANTKSPAIPSANPIYIKLKLLNTSAGVARTAGKSNDNSIESTIRVEARG